MLARQIVGACAPNPKTVEDLLLAAEPFRPGITKRIINALLDFERRRFQNWLVKLDPATDIFEVEDDHLNKLARQALSAGLITIDLTGGVIGVAVPAFQKVGNELKREAELPVFENGEVSKKAITYSLDKHWKIENLDSQLNYWVPGSSQSPSQPPQQGNQQAGFLVKG